MRDNIESESSVKDTNEDSYFTLNNAAMVFGILFGANGDYYGYKTNKANDVEHKMLHAELSRVESKNSPKHICIEPKRKHIVLDSLDD